jgi:hypothetical protein
VHFAANPLAFHLIRVVANAKRQHIRAREDGVNLDDSPIQTASPTALGLTQLEPVVLPVNTDVVSHRNASRRALALQLEDALL